MIWSMPRLRLSLSFHFRAAAAAIKNLLARAATTRREASGGKKCIRRQADEQKLFRCGRQKQSEKAALEARRSFEEILPSLAVDEPFAGLNSFCLKVLAFCF